jgi:hypothetical protein
MVKPPAKLYICHTFVVLKEMTPTTAAGFVAKLRVLAAEDIIDQEESDAAGILQTIFDDFAALDVVANGRQMPVSAALPHGVLPAKRSPAKAGREVGRLRVRCRVAPPSGCGQAGCDCQIKSRSQGAHSKVRTGG